ncbi:5-formyltetrahydrofolate cyclo-ligase [Flagellimonas pelagia]|nr:5-formyltetrahydrofolate cyclo-ligase [Allomuricauda maritima]
MNPIQTQKKDIRNRLLGQRDLIPHLMKMTYDQRICHFLWELMERMGHQTVHTYLPMGSEIDIFPFIGKCLQHKKTIIAPQTLPGRRFNNLELTSLQDVELGIFGTMHPAGNRVFEGSYDLIVLPGLACDAEKYRVGYGGGYYDTFLADWPEAHKVGVFYPFQQIEKVPREPHDMPLDDLLIGRDGSIVFS